MSKQHKPDTISAVIGSRDFHGFNWMVTLNGHAVEKCFEASRKGGYVVLLQIDDKMTCGYREVTRYGVVDYERMGDEGDEG